jgi:Transposase IS4
VITDATTAYVLKVIVYTGKTTKYNDNEIENEKKTVAIVKQLCKPYTGTHRTIYIDRFYSSIDLMKELGKMNLYVTGTVMKNRIPKEMVIRKGSPEFKSMERGDSRLHKYSYIMEDGTHKIVV